ncbi:hypothetical protein ETF27_08010 [Prevotella brunnea]|uniref:Uncharacterized protein n=1 Tax=Prevotella brunnea TaxID=2508867 RepID=A0A5C8GG68_9BACT|nr:hypothetical protein [Prevotella brunnea]TXJ60907.1 hypothetical protein ETF27_08010 [Prevotella brunnea]
MAGITDGIALVGALSVGTMSKAQIVKALRIIGRVGGKNVARAISGAGLLLMAGEIAWCMY